MTVNKLQCLYKELYILPGTETFAEEHKFGICSGWDWCGTVGLHRNRTILQCRTLWHEFLPTKMVEHPCCNITPPSKACSEYLSIQGSSVASECVFSTAGDILDKKRSKLDPKKLSMFIFLNKNYSNFVQNYSMEFYSILFMTIHIVFLFK